MEKEFKRLEALLSTLDPTSVIYGVVLDRLREIKFIADEEFREGFTTEKPIAPPAGLPKEDYEEVTKAINVAETEAAEKEFDNKAQKLDKATVRELLSDASSRGIQIQPIIAKFVPEGKELRFSNVPISSYEDLVKELKDAE